MHHRRRQYGHDSWTIAIHPDGRKYQHEQDSFQRIELRREDANRPSRKSEIALAKGAPAILHACLCEVCRFDVHFEKGSQGHSYCEELRPNEHGSASSSTPKYRRLLSPLLLPLDRYTSGNHSHEKTLLACARHAESRDAEIPGLQAWPFCSWELFLCALGDRIAEMIVAIAGQSEPSKLS